MESVENNKCNYIIVGGCHVSGFGADGSPSFVDIVELRLNLRCVLKKTMFQLKNVTELASILDSHPVDLIFLQVGNYEFDGSLKIFSSVSKDRNTNVSDSRGNDLFYGDRSKFYFLLVFTLKYILMPFIWRHAKRYTEDNLFLLQKLIKSNQDKTFVVITPLPCYHTAASTVRRKAGILYRQYFSLPNTIFIDSYDKFEIIRENFYNRHHLNANGHAQLGNIICEKMLEK
jgi:hypothetical protein